MCWKRVFNSNTGYFVSKIIYTYDGYPILGYVLSRGYVCFGIPGITRIAVCSDKEQLSAWIKILNIKNLDISKL